MLAPLTRFRFPLAAALAAAWGLFGCGELKMDSGDLTARAAAPEPGIDCAACHAYVLQDSNHLFHLFATEANYNINGPITCLDCHATSIASRPTTLFDTVYTFQGSQWHSLGDFPFLEPPFVDSIRAQPIDTVIPLLRNLPVAVPARPGLPPDSGLTEWMTSLAHMDGKVDVVFEARVTDTMKFRDTVVVGSDTTFRGRHASLSPAQETCSAIACHPATGDPWRFAAPSKGLPGLKH